MPDYLALLGRVNVGGHRVGMADLRAAVTELGHTGVRTYIQTGNVFFTSPEPDSDVLATGLEEHLTQRLGFAVPTFVRTTDELTAALAADPFAGVDAGDDTRLLVVSLDRALPDDVALPVVDEARGFTVVAARGREVFVVLRLVNGRPGNVVQWVKRRWGVRGTARFAHTLAKMLAT